MTELANYEGFDSPQQIVDDPELSREQKVTTLENWRETVAFLHSSNPHDMPHHSGLLDQLDEALTALRAARAGSKGTA